jgi:hypothetical protein
VWLQRTRFQQAVRDYHTHSQTVLKRSEDVANRLIELAAALDAPLYDPPNERFS